MPIILYSIGTQWIRRFFFAEHRPFSSNLNHWFRYFTGVSWRTHIGIVPSRNTNWKTIRFYTKYTKHTITFCVLASEMSWQRRFPVESKTTEFRTQYNLPFYEIQFVRKRAIFVYIVGNVVWSRCILTGTNNNRTKTT